MTAFLQIVKEKSDKTIKNFFEFVISAMLNSGKRKAALKTCFQAFNLLKDVHFLILSGDICISELRPEKAIGVYTLAVRKNPSDREAVLKKASVLQTFFPQKCDKILKCYEKALSQGGENAYVYYETGNVYFRKKDFMNAANAYLLALKYLPQNSEFRYSAGVALANLGQYEDGEMHLLIALKLETNIMKRASIYEALAVIYAKSGNNPAKALFMFKKAMEASPFNPGLCEQTGDLYLRFQNFAKAENFYSRAYSLNLRTPEFLNKYAAVSGLNGNFDLAGEILNEACDLYPDDGMTLNNLGVMLMETFDNPEKALNCFVKASEKPTANALTFFNTAKAYAKLNRIKDAAKMFGNALDINKKTNELDERIIVDELNRLFEVA